MEYTIEFMHRQDHMPMITYSVGVFGVTSGCGVEDFKRYAVILAYCLHKSTSRKSKKDYPVLYY